MRLLLLIILSLMCCPVLPASEVLDRLQEALKKSDYKNAFTQVETASLTVSDKLRTYTVHNASMTGEWSKEAREVTGPDMGGYKLEISLKSGSDNTDQWAGRHPVLEFRDGDFSTTPYWKDSGCGSYLRNPNVTIHINWAYNGNEGKKQIVALLALIKSALEPFGIQTLK